MSNLWFIYALSAAVMWGLGYVIDEKILKSGVSPVILMILQTTVVFPLYLIVASRHEGSMAEIKLVLGDMKLLSITILAGIMILFGNLAILHSVADKNATLASMVEISYPIFVVLFSYMLVKDFSVSIYTLFGGIMIFAGVFLVYKTS